LPCYIFTCPGREHEGERTFEQFLHAVPKLIITQIDCPTCGAVAKRQIDKEIKTQSLIGQTQISHSSTVKGTVAHDLEYAFGKVKQNPDGSADPNHRPFTTTGELDRFMNGANDLGPRVLGDDGQPRMKSDGTFVHGGAKLVKYGRGDAPSRNDVAPRKKYRNAAHVSMKEAGGFPDTKSSGLRG